MTIEGFTIRAANASVPRCHVHALIKFREGSGSVIGNRLVGLPAADGTCVETTYGVFLAPGEFSKYVVRGNLLNDIRGTGIDLSCAFNIGELHAIGNTLRNLRVPGDFGIDICGARFGGSVEENTIYAAEEMLIGILAIDGNDLSIRRNVVDGAHVGFEGGGINGVLARNRFEITVGGMELVGVGGLTISRNRVLGAAVHGISLFESTGNSIHDNDFRGNEGIDCIDHSTGSGTAGTANTWLRNLGDDSDPDGICDVDP